MDFRLSMWLLLLLAAHPSVVRPRASGDGHRLLPPGPHRQPQPQRVGHHRPVHRRARALSEFLEPPPPAGPVQHRQNVQAFSATAPGPQGQHATAKPTHPAHRQQQQMQQQQQQQQQEQPGYLSKLMSWLNPFGAGGGGAAGDGAAAKDRHGQIASADLSRYQPNAQWYAPQQPYTDFDVQYEPPHPVNLPASHNNLAPLTNAKPCNPCNQVPWIPIFHSDEGQYGSNAGQNAYLTSPPLQEVIQPDFAHAELLDPNQHNDQNFPILNPHLYTGSMPPLFRAKPFNEAPASFSVHIDHPPPPNFDQSSLILDQQPPPIFDQQPPPNLDQHLSSNIDQPPSLTFGHPPSLNVNHQSILSTNYNQVSTNSEHQVPTQNLDHLPIQNYDVPYPNINYQRSNSQPNTNLNEQIHITVEDSHASSFDTQQTQNYDYDPTLNFDGQSPSIYDDQHPSSNVEQHHQSSQIVDVVKEPPSNLNTKLNNNGSSSVSSNSNRSSIVLHIITPASEARHNIQISSPAPFSTKHLSGDMTVVHFERSPLIDLSGDSELPPSTTKNSSEWSNRFGNKPTDQPVTIPPSKGKAVNGQNESSTPSASLIEYIVSSPDEGVGSHEEERESRLQSQLEHQSERTGVPLSVTTTTQRTTTMPADQRQQESLIESLVQSYEFYKKNYTSANGNNLGGRVFNESEDISASREVIVPIEFDNGKKNKQIIQIIIPYTSQHTPSPFHSTRSVDGRVGGLDREKPAAAVVAHKKKTTIEYDEHVEDNVLSLESRRVSVARSPPERKLRNNETDGEETSKIGNAIDVHRLQKNIDNWTIQEYSKITASITHPPNSTNPRWLASKQIPDEYLLSPKDFEESKEYYDISNEADVQRGTKKPEEETTASATKTTTTTTTTSTPAYATKLKIINATYPKKPRKPAEQPTKRDGASSERVYVVTPIPVSPNSLEDLASAKDRARARGPKSKRQRVHVAEAEAEAEAEADAVAAAVERAYQVLPQAVNNLAVLSSPPESGAPALWGIMEHEEFAGPVEQPRWRSENDTVEETAAAKSRASTRARLEEVSRAR